MAANESTYILSDTAGPNSGADSAFTISKNDQGASETLDTKQLIIERDSRLGPTSNLKQTGFNYVNSIIGSGVIGIPYALHRAGFGLGIVLLLVIAVLTDYSLCILVKAGNIAGVTTYQDVVEAAFGRTGFYLLTVIQFIYPFIAMISYNVIIGDTATKVFIRLFDVTSDNVFMNRNTVVFASTLFITLPLSLQKNMARLNKISLISLLFIFFIMVFIMWRIIYPYSEIPKSSDAYSMVGGGITEAIGIISFAYMCHHSSFLVYESMEDPTQNRWDKITHISLVVSCAIVLVFGVAGYVTFTGFSQGDLLENYCMSDNLALIARLLFTVTIMLTYPIECFVVRDVLEHAVWDGKPPQTTNHHVMVTLIIVMSVFIFSTLTDCLGIVLELNGVLAAVPLAYILPAVTYLKLEPGRTLTWPKAPAFLLALFGTLVAVCGTVYAILNVLDGVTCSHGTEMPYCADASVYKFMEHAQNVTKFNETLIRNGINDLATTTIGVSLIEP